MPKNNNASLFKVVFLAASGFFLFVCMDSTAKYLGSVMPVTQAVWGRYFFMLLLDNGTPIKKMIPKITGKQIRSHRRHILPYNYNVLQISIHQR